MANEPNELRRWLDRFGVTIKALAEAAGLSVDHMSAISRGVAWPSDDAKIAISRATKAHEQGLGVHVPVGVPATIWLATLEAREAAAVNADGV